MPDRTQATQDEIEHVIAKYVMRLLWTIVAIAFAAGGWATKMQMDIIHMQVEVSEIKATVNAHEALLQTENTRANQWRDQIVKELGLKQQRLSLHDYDKAVWLQHNAIDKLMPYYGEVQSIGGGMTR